MILTVTLNAAIDAAGCIVTTAGRVREWISELE